MQNDKSNVSVKLYVGLPHQCSYLQEKTTTLHIIDPSFSIDPDFYSGLLSQGFRRSGEMVYRPGCRHCQACIPARIPVAKFKMNRSQKRTLKKNQDIEIRYRTQHDFSDQHYALYQKYLKSRHLDGGMDQQTQQHMQHFLSCSWGEVELLEGWLDGQLVMVAVTDKMADALSAPYTFYDPQLQHRSLGTFGILCQLERCKTLALPLLYLGYWIEACRKMSYKRAFKPLELLENGQWQLFQDQ